MYTDNKLAIVQKVIYKNLLNFSIRSFIFFLKISIQQGFTGYDKKIKFFQK